MAKSLTRSFTHLMTCHMGFSQNFSSHLWSWIPLKGEITACPLLDLSGRDIPAVPLLLLPSNDLWRKVEDTELRLDTLPCQAFFCILQWSYEGHFRPSFRLELRCGLLAFQKGCCAASFGCSLPFHCHVEMGISPLRQTLIYQRYKLEIYVI